MSCDENPRTWIKGHLCEKKNLLAELCTLIFAVLWRVITLFMVSVFNNASLASLLA